MLRPIPQTSSSDLFYSSDDTASTESDTDIGSSTNDGYECTDSDMNVLIMSIAAHLASPMLTAILIVNRYVYTLHPYMQALLYYECAG